MSQLSYLQAVSIGLLQGVSELFPVSSLGHSILVPALIGGSWEQLVTQQSESESPYLAFIVGLHVATALALLLFFWRDWVRLIRGLFSSIARRRIETVDEKMIWLLIIATIPAGLVGLLLEHPLRTLFAKPLAASIFLTINGLVLFSGEFLRRRFADRDPDRPMSADPDVTDEPGIVARIGVGSAVIIGVAQITALFAGISRSGVTMVAGLLRGLNHEQAVRFAFLLATPIILGAGVYKLPDLAGPLGNGIRGQVVVGSVAAFVAALISVKFLTRYFETRTLTPFAIYCVLFGGACVIYFS
jgi:undecaprenyl-diphosphatase